MFLGIKGACKDDLCLNVSFIFIRQLRHQQQQDTLYSPISKKSKIYYTLDSFSLEVDPDPGPACTQYAHC